MTIEIQRPELEALIHERMKSGAFQNVEDVLMQALKASPAPDERDVGRSDEKSSATGAELVEAMQTSPFKEIGLEPGREHMPVRDAGFDGVVARYEGKPRFKPCLIGRCSAILG
jgi:hypothetical protein